MAEQEKKDFGSLLRKRREELGIDKEKIAGQLKIKSDYLTSIEAEDFERLPAPVYAIGYVRIYAAYLQLDPEPFVDYYSRNLSAPSPSTILPVASFKKKTPAIVYVVTAVVLLGVGIYFFRSYRPREEVAATPRQVIDQSPPSSSAEVGAPTVPASGWASIPTEHHLSIRAIDTTWLSITFSTGKKEEALLHRGESREWTFADKSVLKFGNAGGVEITLDGNELGQPGNPGQVLTITLPQA